MPRLILEDELRAIERAVRGHTEGLSAHQIADRLNSGLSHRTLQFRLKGMVENGRLERHGPKSRAKYSLPAKAAEPAEDELSIPLTGRSPKLLELVKRPLRRREPVGYKRGFLDSYIPNSTAYLDLRTRIELGDMGRSTPGPQPAGTYAKHVLERLLIDLSWNSSRLEGNTYTLLDTRRLIQLGEAAEGRDLHETQMILNHKEAIHFLVEGVDEIGFNRYTICNLHAILANNLLPNAQAAGRLRQIPVGIQGSVFHPLEVPQLVEECFDQILAKAAAIRDPFEQAFFVMVQLPYLQPFDDVNKGVSRLSANIPLIRANLSPLSFVDVPRSFYGAAMLAIYERNYTSLLRDVFLWAYARSAAQYAAVRQSLGEPDPFRLAHRDELREVVSTIVRNRMEQQRASAYIKKWMDARVDAASQERFRQTVESELLALTRQNFARYRVRPSEFDAWWRVWTRKPSSPVE